jgi:DNA-binding MarR family transcriptional regulator
LFYAFFMSSESTAAQAQAPTHTEADAGAALHALAAAVIRFVEHPRQMSLTAVSTLAALERRGACRITELAALQGVAQPSMTALVGSLEQAGLVRRDPDPSDRRAVLVSLTPSGRDYLAARRRGGAERLSTLIDRLSPADAAALRAAVPALLRLRELQEEAMELNVPTPAQKAEAKARPAQEAEAKTGKRIRP